MEGHADDPIREDDPIDTGEKANPTSTDNESSDSEESQAASDHNPTYPSNSEWMDISVAIDNDDSSFEEQREQLNEPPSATFAPSQHLLLEKATLVGSPPPCTGGKPALVAEQPPSAAFVPSPPDRNYDKDIETERTRLNNERAAFEQEKKALLIEKNRIAALNK